MKYSFASITRSCENFGNLLIEENVKKLLEKNGFGKETYEFDSFVPPSEETIKGVMSTDFLIVPGCTTIALKDYPGIDFLVNKINIPIFNIGASLPTGRQHGGLDKINKFFQPIGSRDPYTDRFLRSNSIGSRFIGCPTLFSSDASSYRIQEGDIVFVFGSEKKDQQLQILNEISSIHKEKIKVFVQNTSQGNYFSSANLKYSEYSPEKLFTALRKARIVISGRLHTTLPAVAFGVPSFFLGTMEDERFSLLDYLEIKRFSVEDHDIVKSILQAIDSPSLITNNNTIAKAEHLRKKIASYLEEIKNFL